MERHVVQPRIIANKVKRIVKMIVTENGLTAVEGVESLAVINVLTLQMENAMGVQIAPGAGQVVQVQVIQRQRVSAPIIQVLPRLRLGRLQPLAIGIVISPSVSLEIFLTRTNIDLSRCPTDGYLLTQPRQTRFFRGMRPVKSAINCSTMVSRLW